MVNMALRIQPRARVSGCEKCAASSERSRRLKQSIESGLAEGDFSVEPIHGSGQQLVVPVIDIVPDTQEQRLDSFSDRPNFNCMEIAEMWQSQYFVNLAQET